MIETDLAALLDPFLYCDRFYQIKMARENHQRTEFCSWIADIRVKQVPLAKRNNDIFNICSKCLLCLYPQFLLRVGLVTVHNHRRK